MSTQRCGYYFFYAIFAELYNLKVAVYIFEIIFVAVFVECENYLAGEFIFLNSWGGNNNITLRRNS